MELWVSNHTTLKYYLQVSGHISLISCGCSSLVLPGNEGMVMFALYSGMRTFVSFIQKILWVEQQCPPTNNLLCMHYSKIFLFIQVVSYMNIVFIIKGDYILPPSFHLSFFAYPSAIGLRF